MESKIRVGYCGPEEKWHRIGWPGLVEYGKEHGCEIVHIDLTKSIEDQGPFNLIVHKMTYIMSGHDMSVDPGLQRLYDFSKAHPDVVFIDDLDAVAITLDREEMNEAISKVVWPEGIVVGQPQAALLEASDIDTIKKVTANLHFPLLAKPKSGCSTTDSHMLRIATTPEALVGVPTPTMLQEYINHGGIVYKIYTLGDQIEVTARTSTRDVALDENLILDFHSQHSNEDNGLWARPQELDKVPLPIDDFQKMSKAIRNSLNMQLIGFDILKDHSNKYWIVDINFFPGYKNVVDVWPKFYNFFMSQINKE